MQRQNRLTNYLSLSRSLFQQTLLQLFLAFNAMARPRHSLKPLGVDFLAAVDALAEAALANTRERPLHHLQQLPFVVALAEEELFSVGTGGPVGDVRRRIFVGGTAVSLRALNRPAQILLPRFEPLLKRF